VAEAIALRNEGSLEVNSAEILDDPVAEGFHKQVAVKFGDEPVVETLRQFGIRLPFE
jgi:hypothetical protein